MKRTHGYELIVLISLVVLVCLWWVIFNNRQPDFNLHDTYYVSVGGMVMPPVLCFLIFIVYLVKEAFYRYQRRFQNIILLASLAGVNILLLFGANIARRLSKDIVPAGDGFTIYPPLSALPKAQPPAGSPNLLDHYFEILLYTQIFFLVMLVIVAVVTGLNWKSTKNVS
ncbi:MAG TPA: hypothetical protein VIM55_12355 [Mucilaginibacter sp.]